jgi:predicted RNA-binding protein YlxR (DUF448 family)
MRVLHNGNYAIRKCVVSAAMFTPKLLFRKISYSIGCYITIVINHRVYGNRDQKQ